MNIAELLLARGADDAPAVLYRDEVLNYRELRRKVAAISDVLLAAERVKGDRIGICAENSPFFVTAYLGIIRAGLVAVPFQTELQEGAFQEIVRNAGIKAVIVSPRFAGQLRPWAETAGAQLLGAAELRHRPGLRPRPAPEIDAARDLAALIFTSGSTGTPKGVMVSHQNIACNTRDIVAYMGLTAKDRVMVVLPFHYCFGASLLHTHLLAGASVVLNNNFKLFPEAVLLDMLRRECTGFAGVPSTYQILLRRSRFREMLFPKLRWFQQAGGKLPNPQIAEVLAAFPQVRYYLMYGQTEGTARLSYLPPERLSDKLGSIGRGLPSTRLEVLRPDGAPVTAGSRDTGEIVASGDNITLGYWNDPDETSKYFRNGKLHTGDIARVDPEGYIYIVEREREMIKSGGNRVSAKEVEDAIAEIPEVVEVAVLGAPHELLGESIRAYIVAVPGAKIGPREVREQCRKRLAAFKVPEEVVFLDTMPHYRSGKIMKSKLLSALSGSKTPDTLTAPETAGAMCRDAGPAPVSGGSTGKR
jgi:acyl-CoA synthetase (AMP-forming)/AMP-acid ligase II